MALKSSGNLDQAPILLLNPGETYLTVSGSQFHNSSEINNHGMSLKPLLFFLVIVL
jgi:hypothetical protein